MSRAWPYPDLRNGTTFHHITDTHFGAAAGASFVENWLDRTRQDLDALQGSLAGHVHTGDCIHWDKIDNVDDQDNQYEVWRDAIKAADDKPFLEMPGNHDLNCFDGGGEDFARTAEEWASDVSTPSPLQTIDLGDIKVIGLTADAWEREEEDPYELRDYILSQTTLDWLDDELQAAGKPSFIACHITLDGQFSWEATASNTADVGNPGLIDVLDANDNAVGWLSGHHHEDLTDPNAFKAFQYRDGSRYIFGINSPPCGGGRAGVPYADHQYKSISCSTFITYLGDAVEVRWRDHNARKWRPGPTQRRILLEAREQD